MKGADPRGDALTAARLVARDPGGLGGLWLRSADEAVVEAVLGELRTALPCRRLPLNVDEERLTGGLDVAGTLAAGRPVHMRGLLDEMRRGLLVVAQADRLPPGVAGRIAAAMDGGGPALLLLSGADEDETPPACLVERVAFHLSASGVETGATDVAVGEITEPMLALAGAAASLGIASSRADVFAWRVSTGHAALSGRAAIAGDDLAFVARTILAARATRMPAPPPEQTEGEAPPPRETNETPEDVVLDAVRTALPPDALAALLAGDRRGTARGAGTGARRRSPLRGRPLGARAGLPRGGARLALLDTLRAAAPWQKVRGREGRLLLRRDDLRIRRFETRSPALTVLAVDASGSAAAARLAEAKGAAELLLQQSYVRRAEVALVAFRGGGAELLLPPTRSLTRARRLLAELPGGGGTPLAAGIDAARDIALAAAARGRTPALVVLTDGRANIAANGAQDRAAAGADAQAAARRIAAAGLKAMVIDIGARPQPEAARLAASMAGRYLHLPRADAARVQAGVHAALT